MPEPVVKYTGRFCESGEMRMRAYERFLNYIRIHTTSSADSGTHPSFEGEWDLARMLEAELTALGLGQVHVDEHCYVYAKLPASPGCENAPAIGFLSHMDTSDEAFGKNVHAFLHDNYDGGDCVLPGSRKVLSPKRFPFLKNCIGETLITSDGMTLLGADDKAGIAEIMTALEEILKGDLPHGPVSIAFTPDEEIGEGTEFFDLGRFGAQFAYTVDGGDVNCVEYENFNAASADVQIRGQSAHPGDAKGIMRNASKLAMEFHALLPAEECPECTEGREGFFHLAEMTGRVAEAELHYLIRDHDRKRFEERKLQMQTAAELINQRYGAGTAELRMRDSYYNMIGQILPAHRHLVENAEKAIRKAGMEPMTVPVRGGTDGARLSFMGLPCPNLGTGGFNFHGEYECITVERMDRAVQVILNLIDLYKGY